jgi:hypothetical protein
MEGTHMVARIASDRDEKDSLVGVGSIKLLDLLTNRYHAGVMQEGADGSIEVELPASSHFQAGQRVRFVAGAGQGVVRRNSMRRGFIAQVWDEYAENMRLRLVLLPESAVA